MNTAASSISRRDSTSAYSVFLGTSSRASPVAYKLSCAYLFKGLGVLYNEDEVHDKGPAELAQKCKACEHTPNLPGCAIFSQRSEFGMPLRDSAHPALLPSAADTIAFFRDKQTPGSAKEFGATKASALLATPCQRQTEPAAPTRWVRVNRTPTTTGEEREWEPQVHRRERMGSRKLIEGAAGHRGSHARRKPAARDDWQALVPRLGAIGSTTCTRRRRRHRHVESCPLPLRQLTPAAAQNESTVQQQHAPSPHGARHLVSPSTRLEFQRHTPKYGASQSTCLHLAQGVPSHWVHRPLPHGLGRRTFIAESEVPLPRRPF